MEAKVFNSKNVVESFKEIYTSRTPDGLTDDGTIAMVLGSGFKSVVDEIEVVAQIETQEISEFPKSTVVGHKGLVIRGKLGDRDVLVLAGRTHAYEGHAISSIPIFIELCHAIGIKKVILTNAAGSMVPGMGPGSLMFIKDHINLSFLNPLLGPVTNGGYRFPDMCEPYDSEWTSKVRQSCLSQGIETFEGVYLWTSGPSYETRAEIKFFRQIGADVVGMSTVGENLRAKELGLSVLGLSLVSNYSTGLADKALSHNEVLESGQEAQNKINTVLKHCLL